VYHISQNSQKRRKKDHSDNLWLVAQRIQTYIRACALGALGASLADVLYSKDITVIAFLSAALAVLIVRLA
jgi:hypothetical protein